MPVPGRSTTLEKLGRELNTFRSMVRSAGRDPEKVKIILNCHPRMSETKTPGPRGVLSGTPEEIADDLPGIEKLGVHHIFFDLNYPAAIPLGTQLSLLRKLMKLVKS